MLAEKNKISLKRKKRSFLWSESNTPSHHILTAIVDIFNVVQKAQLSGNNVQMESFFGDA